MKKYISLFLLSVLCLCVSAQGEQSSSGMMRSELKIYVVVAVLVIIFTGITLYLFSMERRLKKLEENAH